MNEEFIKVFSKKLGQERTLMVHELTGKGFIKLAGTKNPSFDVWCNLCMSEQDYNFLDFVGQDEAVKVLELVKKVNPRYFGAEEKKEDFQSTPTKSGTGSTESSSGKEE